MGYTRNSCFKTDTIFICLMFKKKKSINMCLRPEGNLQKSALSFDYVDVRNSSQIVRLGSKHPYPLSQLIRA